MLMDGFLPVVPVVVPGAGSWLLSVHLRQGDDGVRKGRSGPHFGSHPDSFNNLPGRCAFAQGFAIAVVVGLGQAF